MARKAKKAKVERPVAPLGASAAGSWPADHVERRPLAGLIPYARNARTHTAEQIAQLAESIRQWGWTIPILVDETGGIIAGHARALAAQKLSLAEVPVMVARGWSDAQKRAYVLADNQIALNAGWDKDLLGGELLALRLDGFDLGLMAFDLPTLSRLSIFDQEGLTDPDDVPAAPALPVTCLGDVWTLGRHRIACGSCTEAETVHQVLAGEKPHLMVTDPPYGVKYDPAWRKRAGVNNSGRMGVVENDDRSDWREAWALFPGDVAYVWHGALHAAKVAESLEINGFQIRSQIIWAKPSLIMGRGHYHWQHEPAWYAVRGEGHWVGDRKQTTLWPIANRNQDAETVHSTQKPVECMRRPIENNSVPGDHVYEPFSGSGTTIIAAETTGRFCRAIELNPAYVDVAVKRWEAFTGKEATLETTGETFAQVGRARLATDRDAA